MYKYISLILLPLLSSFFGIATAQSVDLAQTPILALKSAPGLVMLTMSRDHRLFYTAYDDTSDLDRDGVPDIGFKPTITYYGNFVSNRCYDYISTGTNAPLFRPMAFADASTGCKSGSTQRWHGNWLNWATTSRMDALRRVLYGGYRVVDDATTSSTTYSSTVLQGAWIPKDNHVWGKEYSYTRDRPVYDITQYTNLSMPASGKQIMFVVVSPTQTFSPAYPFKSQTTAPALRYVTNVDENYERIWCWASADVAQGIASSPVNLSKCPVPPATTGRTGLAVTDLALKVEACVPLPKPNGTVESGCTPYPSSTNPVTWKPTGTLHEFGSTDALKFGLLTGSYQNNYSGGVVRQNIRSFKNEYDPATGRFGYYNAGTFVVADDGIARQIDRITIHGWNGSSYNCVKSNTDATGETYKTSANRLEGACRSWGAPVGEMMYEGLRYFSNYTNALTASSAFVSGLNSSNGVGTSGSADAIMGFPNPPSWKNPFRPKSVDSVYGNPICSRPVQMVIADPLVSYDSDQLPGTKFGITSGYGSSSIGSLTGLNVSTKVDQIWSAESLGSRNVFIGESQYAAGLTDGNPTAKAASGLSGLRGLAPDETMTQGSYYSAGVAKFAREEGLTVGAVPDSVSTVNKTVDTISIALGSRTPKIQLTGYGGKTVSIVPISKAVYTANKNAGQYQATGAITGFYYVDKPTVVSNPVIAQSIVSATGTPGNNTLSGTYAKQSIVVNYSDSDQGTDNETDAQVQYDFYVSQTSSALYVVNRQVQPSPGGIQSDSGYVISGTTADGLYLETRNCTNTPSSTTPCNAGTAYYLDTLLGQGPKTATSALNGSVLPAYATVGAGAATQGTAVIRGFTLSSSAGSAGSYLPHDPLWYAAKYGGAGVLDANGNPTNYFSIVNPAQLPSQMGKAFRAAASLAAVASTSVVGVGQRSLGSAAIYQASYDSLTWSSRLYAFPVSATNGTASNTPVWEGASMIPAPSSRNLYLGRGGSNTPVQLLPSNWGSLTSAEKSDFGNDTNKFAYLLGDTSREERNGGSYRNRGTTAAGDSNVSGNTSNGIYKPGSVMGDVVNSDPQIVNKKDYNYSASDSTYTAFVNSINYELIAFGANDGFFHIFNAAATTSGGSELMGFMPQSARTSISNLADPAYSHRYTVDGPVAVGHAKIVVPDDSTANWRSILVGTGGGGAATVFAINASSTTFNANKVLWEINASSLASSGSSYRCSGANNSDALGNVLGRPVIGKVKIGSTDTWVAIFPNGVNSPCDTARLFVVRLDNGNLIKILDTNTGIAGNGLNSIQAVRKTSGNQDTIDYVYGADIKGNIWRFDLSSTSTSAWSAAWVFQSVSSRPITAELLVAPPPSGAPSGNMIYFGTGKYLASSDATTTATQAFYGVLDDLSNSSNTSPSVSGDTNLVSASVSSPSGSVTDVRASSAPAGNPWYQQSGKKGWVVTLPAGERVIAPAVRYTQSGVIDSLLFTSIVPSTDDCVAGIDTWITAINITTGGSAPAFDGVTSNSIKIAGGSPRGVFVLSEASKPTLYISQTVFNVSSPPTSSYATSTGGVQTVTINGVPGQTRVLGVNLKPGSSGVTVPATIRQVWRQLK